MASALLALTLWLSGPQQLVRANLWLQDLSLRLHQPPASPDVVLVLVDERSLASIGRWPWRRALHAHVIQHITAGQPQSIGLDFLLAEPDLDYPEDDLVLAESMAHSGRVVLPVVRGLDEHSATLPLPLFTQAAARLGHVHVPLDEDGGVRRFYAREGLGPQPWLYLGLSMLCVTTPERPDCQATQHKAPAERQRQGLTHIALAQGQPPFAMYAYIDVLRGQIPASAFRNKHVVIGTAAAGLGTALRPRHRIRLPRAAAGPHPQRCTAKPAHHQRQRVGQPLVEHGACRPGFGGTVGAGPLGSFAHLCRDGAADLAGSHGRACAVAHQL